MRKVLGVPAILFVCCSFVFAQVKINGVGLGVGSNFLIGNSPIMDSEISPNFGIYGIYNLTQKLGLKFQTGYGQFGVKSVNKNYATSFLPVELYGLYSLFPNSKLNPFLQLGLGALRFSINNSASYYDGMVIGGVGFKYVLNPSWTWMVSTSMRYTTGDDFDGYNNRFQDGYFNLQSGLTYNLKNDKQQFKRKNELKEKEILVQHYSEQQRVLLKTHLENLRIEINKLEQEITHLSLKVETHVVNINKFSRKLYDFANNIGEREKVKFLAVKDQDGQ